MSHISQDKDKFWEIFNSVQNNEKVNNHENVNANNDDITYETTNHLECINCKGNLVFDEGNYVCTDCSIIQQSMITSEQEWRYYGDGDTKSVNPNRVGMATNKLLPQSSLGSMIGNGNCYSYEFHKIKQYHKWNAMPYKERSLWAIFSQLQVKAKKAGIPAMIIDDAKYMYKTLSETRISRGVNRKGLEAACIYVSCKIWKVPRSAKEIAEIFGLKVSNMTRGCKKFQEIMKLSKYKKKHVVKASGPLDYVSRFCSNLDLDSEICSICEYVANKAYTSDIVDENTPPSIAAGSIFLVCMLCGISLSKKKVAKACKISEVTISKCFKRLYEYRSHLFSDEIKKNYNLYF